MPVLLGASHSCSFFVRICTRVASKRNVSSSQQAFLICTANFAVIRCSLIGDGLCSAFIYSILSSMVLYISPIALYIHFKYNHPCPQPKREPGSNSQRIRSRVLPTTRDIRFTRRDVEIPAAESKSISVLDPRRESAVDTTTSAPSKNDQADHSLASIALLKGGVA
jgi:hypothetical protein